MKYASIFFSLKDYNGTPKFSEYTHKTDTYGRFHVKKPFTVTKGGKPTVFPNKGKDFLVLKRRLNRRFAMPETTTIKVNCGGKRHEITLTDNGKMTLHAHKNTDGMEVMQFFGDRCRCLEIREAWKGIYYPKDNRHFSDHKKKLPRPFHGLADLLRREKEYGTKNEWKGESIRNGRALLNSYSSVAPEWEQKRARRIRRQFYEAYEGGPKENALDYWRNPHDHSERFLRSDWIVRVRGTHGENLKVGEYFILDSFGSRTSRTCIFALNKKRFWGKAWLNEETNKWEFEVDSKTGEIK